MSLSSKELHKICHMRLQGKPWREIKEAIPHKNVYQQFKRLSMMIVLVNGEGHKCESCGHVHVIKVTPRKNWREIEAWEKNFLKEDYAKWALYRKLGLYIDGTKIDPSLKDDE